MHGSDERSKTTLAARPRRNGSLSGREAAVGWGRKRRTKGGVGATPDLSLAAKIERSFEMCANGGMSEAR